MKSKKADRKGGGLKYRRHGDDAFFEKELQTFFVGAKLTYLNKGISGVMFSCRDRARRDSFVDLETGAAVNTIVIKIIPIGFTKVVIQDQNHSMESTSEDEFRAEVAIQLRVSRMSDFICPSVLFAKLGSAAEINRLLNHPNFVQVSRSEPRRDGQFGLIVMEMIVEPKPVNLEFADQKAMVRAKFLHLASLGINHGDYHTGNILMSGRKMYIVDFGRAFEIDPTTLGLIQASIEEKDYTQALRLLICKSPIDGDVFDAFYTELEQVNRLDWANVREVNDQIASIVDWAKTFFVDKADPYSLFEPIPNSRRVKSLDSGAIFQETRMPWFRNVRDGSPVELEPCFHFLVHSNNGHIFSNDYLELSDRSKIAITGAYAKLLDQEKTHLPTPEASPSADSSVVVAPPAVAAQEASLQTYSTALHEPPTAAPSPAASSFGGKKRKSRRRKG